MAIASGRSLQLPVRESSTSFRVSFSVWCMLARSLQIDHPNNSVFTKQIEHGYSGGLFHQRHKCFFDFWITIRDPRSDGADFVALFAYGPSFDLKASLL